MKQVRKNVFETNSSSTHSLALSTWDDLESTMNALENALYDPYDKNDLFEALYLCKKLEDLIKKSIEEV